MKTRVLMLRPEENAYSPLDQSAGARLAWRHGMLADAIQLDEDVFNPEAREALEEKAHRWGRNVLGIVGATNVPQSVRLGEIAEEMNVLCFVANNNPSVWQRRRHVFHIGLPTAQTAEAVAYALARAKFTRVFLLHDETEFQNRVATRMKSALEKRDIRVSSGSDTEAGWMDQIAGWNADLVYLVYSAERKSLPLAMACKSALPNTHLLFGRSLLRQSFIESLGSAAEGALFVDLFRRGPSQSAEAKALMSALSEEAVSIATANHGFGWDAMTLCGRALSSGQGDVSHAIEYLESGVSLDGVTGSFRFNKENHNGREGFGPTRISRWYNGRLEEAYDV
jgi:ABC-type branched-subunit amino acid transport system substrate-binding protein